MITVLEIKESLLTLSFLQIYLLEFMGFLLILGSLCSCAPERCLFPADFSIALQVQITIARRFQSDVVGRQVPHSLFVRLFEAERIVGLGSVGGSVFAGLQCRVILQEVG